MNNLKSKLQSPLGIAIAAFVAGLFIGWIVIGWGLWPVEWVNAGPNALSPAYQQDWVRMSIEAYGLTGNAEKARAQFEALGETGKDALAAVVEQPGTLSNELLLEYSTVVADLTTEPEKPAARTNILLWLLPVLCLALLLVAGAAAYLFLFRGRAPARGGPRTPTPAQEAAETRRQATYTDYTAQGEEAPVSQFMASYKFGDDLFDDSFSVESSSGEFLGECGVGISEVISEGDPKKVTAFEVWLFDKNDIQTVTKVLASEHAYNDPSLYQQLEAKGELVLVQPALETELETQTLLMRARVVSMAYGDGAMPPQSYFDQLVVELSVWKK